MVESSTAQSPTTGSPVRGVRLSRGARRAQLLVAAREVFAAQGYHAAAMDDIAERAGVSKPVLYQHFPGKAQLVQALFGDLLDRSAALAEAALADVDPTRALIHLVEQLAELHATDHGMRDVMLGATFGLDGLDEARRRLDDAVERLITRAKAAGGVHPDFDACDLPVLMAMMGAVGDMGRDVDPDLWRRYVPFLISTIRSAEGPPLPHPSLNHDQLGQALGARRHRLARAERRSQSPQHLP